MLFRIMVLSNHQKNLGKLKINKEEFPVNIWFMSFGECRMSKLALIVKYLLLLYFFTAVQFHNLGHIQCIIRVH